MSRHVNYHDPHQPFGLLEAGELLAYTLLATWRRNNMWEERRMSGTSLHFTTLGYTADTVSVFFAQTPVQIPGADMIRRTHEIGWTPPSRSNHHTTITMGLHDDACRREHTTVTCKYGRVELLVCHELCLLVETDMPLTTASRVRRLTCIAPLFHRRSTIHRQWSAEMQCERTEPCQPCIEAATMYTMSLDCKEPLSLPKWHSAPSGLFRFCLHQD